MSREQAVVRNDQGWLGLISKSSVSLGNLLASIAFRAESKGSVSCLFHLFYFDIATYIRFIGKLQYQDTDVTDRTPLIQSKLIIISRASLILNHED